MHDSKDIRKNPDKYRASQLKRNQDPAIIEAWLRCDTELRALTTIEQELQARLNKLSEAYGRAKLAGLSRRELSYIQFDMELAHVDSIIAKNQVRINFLEELMTASLTSRYALPGELTPSQEPHQKGLPPVAEGQGVIITKSESKPTIKPAVKPIARPAVAVVAAVPAVAVVAAPAPKSAVAIISNLPDVPAMSS